jgi:hypothetical protein
MSDVRFEIRPLGLWDRAVTPAGKRLPASTFRAIWPATMKLLRREVGTIGGRLVAVQIDVAEGQIRRDGMLYANARANSPAVKVSFESKHGPLTYATDKYDHWQANVRAIALSLESLRAVDRYGVSGSGEQYRGWTALDSKPAEKGLSVEEARTVLQPFGAPGLATVDIINRAFRNASRVHHPDAGGSADAFRLISTARDVLIGAAR